MNNTESFIIIAFGDEPVNAFSDVRPTKRFHLSFYKFGEVADTVAAGHDNGCIGKSLKSDIF